MTCAPAAPQANRHLRWLVPAFAALLIALGTTAAAQPVAAAGYAPRVVIVVGPSGGSTSKYLERARATPTRPAHTALR